MRKLFGLVALGALMTTLPATAQQCVDRYQQMLDQFKKNAGECAKNNRLMTQITDFANLEYYAPGSPGAPTDVPGRIPSRLPPGSAAASVDFTRNSPADFRAILPAQPDGRWRLDGNRIIFNCTQPIGPGALPQNEAFLECARVYVCGAAAAQCGMNMAQSSGNRDCNQISRQCLAANPVPPGTVIQQATAAPSPTAPPVGLEGQQALPGSDPRQQAFTNLSPQCQQDFTILLNASQAGDTATANGAYTRLRQQCDQAMRALSMATGLALPERALSPRASGALASAFNTDPNAVTDRIGRPTEGVPAGGGGVDWAGLLDFGLALAGMGMQMAGGWAAMSVPSYGGRGTDYRSLAAPPIRSAPAQGAPTWVPQRNIPSDITGTK